MGELEPKNEEIFKGDRKITSENQNTENNTKNKKFKDATESQGPKEGPVEKLFYVGKVNRSVPQVRRSKRTQNRSDRIDCTSMYTFDTSDETFGASQKSPETVEQPVRRDVAYKTALRMLRRYFKNNFKSRNISIVRRRFVN